MLALALAWAFSSKMGAMVMVEIELVDDIQINSRNKMDRI